MTKDEFNERYELLERVSDGEVETHHALHPSGAVVMVHLVRGSAEFQGRVLEAVEQLRQEGPKGHVFYVHDVEGLPVVVTRFAMDFVTLESWLASLGAPLEKGPDANLTIVDTRPPGLEQGEPTLAFEAPPPQAPTKTIQQVRPSDPGGASAPAGSDSPPPPPVKDSPGEFTRMFQAVGGADAKAPPVEEPTTESPKPTPPSDEVDPWTDPARRPSSTSTTKEGPGEFTRMFQAAGGTVDETKPTPKPPDKPAARDGEFTRLFEGPLGADDSTSPPPDQASPPAAPPFPGGFASPKPVDSPPASGRPSDGTWSDALRSPTRKQDELPPTPPPSVPPPGPSTGGEYTMIFGGDSPPTPPASKAPPTEVPMETQSIEGAPAPTSKAKGLSLPRVPRVPGVTPRIPNPKAAARRALPRKPRMPRAPKARQVVGALAAVSQGAGKGSSDSAAGQATGGQTPGSSDAPGSGKEAKGPNRKVLGIGLAVVLIMTAGLILFFALWDFAPPVPEAEPTGGEASADSVVA
ncbi:MAG: hypothetical protein ACR2QM_12370 [Longimicrobiales bacterium]